MNVTFGDRATAGTCQGGTRFPMTPRDAAPDDVTLRIVLVGDDPASSLAAQLAPYLDERAVELVVLDGSGDGLPELADQDADLLLLDVASGRARSALDRVESLLRRQEDPPTVLLARLDGRSRMVGELLGCAAKRLESGNGAAAPSVEDITPRQREILRMVARSHTSREIGEKLDISPRTVETHRANMMQRLGIHDVAGLVRFAISEGLVEPEV